MIVPATITYDSSRPRARAACIKELVDNLGMASFSAGGEADTTEVKTHKPREKTSHHHFSTT